MSALTGTVTIKDVDYKIYYSEHDDKLHATVGSEHLTATTYAALKAAISGATRKQAVRVEVPFVTEAGLPGTAIGIHGGTQNLLVIWAGAKKAVQERSINGALVPDVDSQRLADLIQASDRALRELNAFRTEHRLDGESYDNVRDAVKAAQKAEIERLAAEAASADGTVDLDEAVES